MYPNTIGKVNLYDVDSVAIEGNNGPSGTASGDQFQPNNLTTPSFSATQQTSQLSSQLPQQVAHLQKAAATPGLNFAGSSAFSPCSSSQALASHKQQQSNTGPASLTSLLHAAPPTGSGPSSVVGVHNGTGTVIGLGMGVPAAGQMNPAHQQSGFKNSSVNGDDEKSSDNLSVCSEV